MEKKLGTMGIFGICAKMVVNFRDGFQKKKKRDFNIFFFFFFNMGWTPFVTLCKNAWNDGQKTDINNIPVKWGFQKYDRISGRFWALNKISEITFFHEVIKNARIHGQKARNKIKL